MPFIVGKDFWLKKNHRITEYLKLEVTHKDHPVQLPAPHRTI